MSQFSGRQTDSQGLARHRDDRGDMVPDQPHRVLGATKSGGNKGVRAIRRAIKRDEADARNAVTAPNRRRSARAGSAALAA